MNIEKIKEKAIDVKNHKSFQNFLIIGFIAGIQLGNNIILGKLLTKEEFGIYSFVFLNIILIIGAIFNFGQGPVLVRNFSTRNIEEYKWKKYIFNFLLYTSIPVVIVSYGVKSIYNLELFWFIIIMLGSFFFCIINIIAPLLRARGYFNIAVLFERSHPIPFFVMLLIVYLFFDLSLYKSAIFKTTSFFVTLPFFIYFLIKWKEGNKAIEKKIIFEGISFWEINLSVLLFNSIDALLITKILNFEKMALFSIVTSIMQIYVFASTALFNVYSQKFSKSKNIAIGKFFKIILIIIIILNIFYLLFANPILQILFKGKYVVSLFLVALFCIYNSLNLLYILPSCYLVGHSSKSELRHMVIVNAISIGLRVLFIFLLIDYDLNGFLIAAIISQSFRTSGGYYIALFSKKIKA